MILAAVATVTASGSVPPPARSSAAVTAALSGALKATTLVGNTDPGLADVAANGPFRYEGASLLAWTCDTEYNPAVVAHPTPCWFGPPKSKRTLVIFGDSFVANWIPAVVAASWNLGFRVAAFDYSGCVTPFAPGLAANCETWHNALPAAVQPLKPFAVLSASGTPSWGTANDKSLWIPGMELAFRELTKHDPKALRIVIGTGVHLPASDPQCVASYPSDLKKCDYTWSKSASGIGAFAPALGRDAALARAIGAKLIPTVQWACYKTHCPALVKGLLVYVDEDHFSLVYSTWLSKVFTQALKKAGVT